MILADTSVWVSHFRGEDTLLSDERIVAMPWLLHPFVHGELLLGGLPSNHQARQILSSIASAIVAEPTEANAFIQWAELAGTGIGYVDAHLLLSARLSAARLITLDKRLLAQAEHLGLAYTP